MKDGYQEIIRGAEKAVKGIRNKDLKREAFGILLLRMLADSDITPQNSSSGKVAAKHGKKGNGKKRGRLARKKAPDRPGRKGGGIATTAVQKLIGAGFFKKGRDAAATMNALTKKHLPLEASQLRMILLRFSRSGKLKRRVKMKGDKVTYLYTSK